MPINNFLHGRDGLCSFVRSLERERERERENPSARSSSTEASDATTREKEKAEKKIGYFTGG